MGSKKHKKDSKKKKHRSRSRSPVEGAEDRERRKHRKHKDRKKDRSPDVEEVPLDSHLSPPRGGSPPGAAPAEPRSASRERDRRVREHRSHAHKTHSSKDKGGDVSREAGSGAGSGAASGGGSGAGESLSVQEANRVRAQLGLKPLDLNDQPAEDGKLKDDLGEFYHKPAANLSEQRKTEKIRQKLEERKEKRIIEQKLKASLAASEAGADEDAAQWVERSRLLHKQRQDAAKRAALLDEMDSVFGVGALVEEEQQLARAAAYSGEHLRGLRVAHDVTSLEEDRVTILTLADKEVLAEDAEDVLVNVNMIDNEKYKKNIAEAKKARAGYQAYSEEVEEAEEWGAARGVLHKYDDVLRDLQPAAARSSAGFTIGDEDGIEARRFKEMMRRERVLMSGGKRLESLELPARMLASDYYTEQEITTKFKKSKRKGKQRKQAKLEPIDVDEHDAGNAPLHTDDTEVKPLGLGEGAESDSAEAELDAELQAALARARRLACKPPRPLPKVEDLLQGIKEETPIVAEGEGEVEGAGMVVDATAEFCRTLGDIPTYGQAGNRDSHADIMDVEADAPEPEEDSGAWARVDLRADVAPDLTVEAAPALVLEPLLGGGLGGALQLARSKGYLSRAAPPPPARPPPPGLHALHYSIEDKTTGEDDKYRGRGGGGGGGGGGPLQDFREKTHFKPTIKLEYVDDDGHALCPKEAFRYLSHKFHGKGPGKNKQEKRIKKQVQEGLMKKMSSTDTPLNTLQMLQDKQRETQSPYIVLSGAGSKNPHH